MKTLIFRKNYILIRNCKNLKPSQIIHFLLNNIETLDFLTFRQF